MKIDDINETMTLLEIFGADAKAFFNYVIDQYPVTESGEWGDLDWWNQVVAKYRQKGVLACGGSALVCAAEFAGRRNNLPAEVYLRLWALLAPSVYAKEAYDWIGSFGSKELPSLRKYIANDGALIFDECDNGTMPIKTALGLIESLNPDDEASGRLMEYIIERDETLIPLAYHLLSRGGMYGLPQIH